jgi:hypothetical protein
MNVCIDDNRHLRKFFYQYASSQTEILCDVRERLPNLLNQYNGKIKPVNHAKYQQQRVLEYKVVVDGSMACRVAFTVVKQTITVIFISEVLIKAQFCKLLAKTALLD